jgi:hypothetical protein
MKHPAGGVIRVLVWVFLAAPWLAWVAFHPLADARLAWVLVVHPREASAAMMVLLRNAYDVPPFSQMSNALRQPNAIKPIKMSLPHHRRPESKLQKPAPDAKFPEAKQSAPEKRIQYQLPLPLRSTGWEER